MRFGILGNLAVWPADDRPAHLPGHKVRTLLAVLLVHEGRPVSADALADVLWGDEPPGNLIGALHTTVWQLRRALEKAESGAGTRVVVSRPPGYLLDVSDHDVDARRFEYRLRRARAATDTRDRVSILGDALAEWRGPALADFTDAEFARPAIARLEEQRLTALEDRAHAMLELGEHRLLVSELADLVVRHPMRERLRAAHMRALYGSGRQSEALAGFDELRELLAEELGVEPGTELVTLRQSILERDPVLAPSPTPITTTARPVTNLPAPVSGLIGRDAAVVQVRALLEASRLVTLHGIGGVGKTSLALAAARQVAGQYPDGVWLVELSIVAAGPDEPDPFSAVADQVAIALGVRTTAREDWLTSAVRAKQMLLVLDNCEHVVAAAAQLVGLVLQAAPGVRVLATSQEPLGIAGERLWTVPPLALPTSLAQAATSSAVQLFVARATDASAGFVLDENTVEAVDAICRRLDGLPLALELAATRVRALGVHELAARLEDRFALLTQGMRGAPARHRTLRAALDWTWELLTEPERVVLRRLAVFSGGCPLQMAEDVCAGGVVGRADVLDLVARLVDRSLVTVTDVAGVRRYGLLESVAAYSAERLREAGEEADVRLRHARYHADLAERVLPHLRGPSQRRWLERMDAERANFRAALDAGARLGANSLALRMVNALAWYWFLRGRLAEAKRAFTVALDGSPTDGGSPRATALAWQAGFGLRAGDASYDLDRFDELENEVADPVDRAIVRWFLGFTRIGFGGQDSAEKYLDRALGEFRNLDYAWGTAAALAALATRSILRGDLDATRQYGEESAALFRDLGDGWGRLQATDALASLSEVLGRYDEAARLHRDGLRIAEALGLWNEASTKMSGLGRIALLGGDYPQARELHERALRLAAEQSYTFGQQFAEVGLGLVARREGRLDAAEMHLRRWLDWCRQLDGEYGVALILAELGFVAEQRGDAETALRLHREGSVAAWGTGDPRTIALSLEGVAGTYSLLGDHERAALLSGAAQAVRAGAGAPLPPAERGDVDRITARGVAAVGDAFAKHVGDGRLMELSEARRLVFDD
ncbi:BTAD domain-containing putative transcriptional regulator [Micromonospora maris]|uniref:BTAD domain-containing putative transcriptional regulator n=1 Tax=Micromonospora maris TaxID=1003110 RepID=UPI002E13F6E1|nr:winged helix-turn-helix domain-containing protein [Micromonospora maris]